MSYPIFPASSSASGSSKLPIPRLHKQRSEPPRRPPVNRQNRVSRACLSCRSRKIKCNGQQPQCSNCSESASSCVYASSRKDRLKTATQQNQDLIAMLQDLRQHQSIERAARIDDLLASVAEDVADAAATVQDPTDKYRGRLFEDERGEANVSVEAGSAGEPDLLDEDIMRDEETRVMGSVGRASEVQWLRKLHAVGPSELSEGGPRGLPADDEVAVNERLAATRERQGGHATPPFLSARKASFYLDDEAFEVDMLVDAFEMPPYDIAKRLLSAYLGSAHNTFPILTKETLVNRFHHYYTSLQRGNPCDISRIWQATLNVVFAIGAVYSRLTIIERQADPRDDLVYHSRAWALSLKHPWWFSHADLPHMQITGLLSVYYLSIGHVNRSWILIGNAMRLGFALGMHLCNEDDHSSAVRKELNNRIWWAHYALERVISALTGRPSLGMGSLCSVPLPLPLSSDDIVESVLQAKFGGGQGRHSPRPQRSPGSRQTMDFSTSQNLDYDDPGSGPANSGSYLRSMINLSEITQSALALYAADTVRESWESVQRSIAQGNEALDVWATDLPEGFNFLHRSDVISHRYRREQNVLGIMYHSTKILITRPCLCRLDRRVSHQTANSNTFNQRAALLCVESAKSISNILPDAMASNLVLLYQAGPWWQMIHVIMQALVVLLLEIVLESRYSSDDHQVVMPSMKKLLNWLRVMRLNNGMAVRAYSLSLELMKKLAPIIKLDIGEFINEDEMITSPTKPSPAPSAPASTHTPYPDVLNPVEKSQAAHVSFAAPMTKQPLRQQQEQQQQRQERQQSMYGTLSDAQHRPVSSQKSSSQTNQNTEPFQLLPSFIEHDLKFDLSTYQSVFNTSSGYEQAIFPGYFVTSFDEHNLFAKAEF